MTIERGLCYMEENRKYYYNSQKGHSTYEIEDPVRGLVGFGRAQVEEKDMDFRSEFTGLTIAELKAEMDLCKKIISYETEREDNELVEEYSAYLKILEDRLQKYISGKKSLFKQVRAKREREDKMSQISFEDLGDLTAYMTEEQKAQAEKEIQEGLAKVNKDKGDV